MSKLLKTPICKPEKWLIEAAAEIGLDFSELTHEMTNEFISHTIKQHGDTNSEKARGQLPITYSEFELLPDIVRNPNSVIIGAAKYGKIINAYLKRNICSSIIYIEEVLCSKKNKALRSKTMYKKVGMVSDDIFFKIVSNNANTDVSKAKIVVGTGGNPGGEV